MIGMVFCPTCRTPVFRRGGPASKHELAEGLLIIGWHEVLRPKTGTTKWIAVGTCRGGHRYTVEELIDELNLPKPPEDDMPAKPITYPYLTRSADFETYDGRRHRVRLARSWAPPVAFVPALDSKPGTVVWLMCNPSDAAIDTDDMTITKCRGFTERWGYSAMVIHNRYTLVATNAAELGQVLAAGYPVEADADNAQRIAADLAGAALVVAAWGDPPGGRLDLHQVEAWARSFHHDLDLHAIGFTGQGVPRHPSRAEYTGAPIRWLHG